jgi:GT2 family glycosyltransferase
MPPAPPVSVVIPAYNRSGSIAAAIASVLRQSFADFELVVVDDGSTDGTAAAVASISDPRLRLVAHASNRGAAAARNTGLEEARGAWIAYQDSDDEWLPRKLEKQMARLAEPDAGWIAAYCGLLTVRPRGDTTADRLRLSYTPEPHLAAVEGDLLPGLMRTSLVSTQTLVVRRDRLRAIGGFDESLPALEDWECMLRLAPLGRVALVDEPLVVQRFSANSITMDPRRRAEARALIVAKHRALLAREPALLAEHYQIVAGAWRALGELGRARAALAEARALRPRDPRLWAASALVAARALAGPAAGR